MFRLVGAESLRDEAKVKQDFVLDVYRLLTTRTPGWKCGAVVAKEDPIGRLENPKAPVKRSFKFKSTLSHELYFNNILVVKLSYLHKTQNVYVCVCVSLCGSGLLEQRPVLIVDMCCSYLINDSFRSAVFALQLGHLLRASLAAAQAGGRGQSALASPLCATCERWPMLAGAFLLPKRRGRCAHSMPVTYP